MLGCHHFHCKRASHDLVLLARMQRERALKKEEKKKKRDRESTEAQNLGIGKTRVCDGGFPVSQRVFVLFPHSQPLSTHTFSSPALLPSSPSLHSSPENESFFFFYVLDHCGFITFFFLVRGPMNQKHRAKTKKKMWERKRSEELQRLGRLHREKKKQTTKANK